jgi:hypothetical protein
MSDISEREWGMWNPSDACELPPCEPLAIVAEVVMR